MEKKKNPRIPPWKVWILIITTMQAIIVVQLYWIQYQNTQSHQLLWDSVLRQAQFVNEHIESMNQYMAEQIRLEEGVQGNMHQLLR